MLLSLRRDRVGEEMGETRRPLGHHKFERNAAEISFKLRNLFIFHCNRRYAIDFGFESLKSQISGIM